MVGAGTLGMLAATSVPDSPPRVPADVWPMYQFASDHNAVFAGENAAQWNIDLGAKINGGLALVGSTLYADSFNHKIYAIDANSGKIQWTGSANNILMSTPVVAHSRVLVGSGDNDVLTDSGMTTVWGRPEGDDVMAFDTARGSVAWTYHTAGEDMPSPAIVGNRAIFSNGDMHAYALDLRNGKQLWRVAIPGITTMASATADGKRVFLVATLGTDFNYNDLRSHLLALDLKTGRTIWSVPYGNSDCSPTVGGNLVYLEGTRYIHYVPSDSSAWMGTNTVYAFDARSGALKWSFESNAGYFTSVASNERAIAGTYVDGALYQALPVANMVAAFDAQSGRVLWRFPTSAPVKMSPVVVDGVVIFGDTAGMLYAVERKSGQLRHVESYRSSFSTSPPIVAGSTIYIANGTQVMAIPLRLMHV